MNAPDDGDFKRVRRWTKRPPGTGGATGQRGFSVSVLICLLIPTLLICIGLAVDGAAKAAADRRAEALAAQAARVGLDAAAPALVSGSTIDDAGQQAVAAAAQLIAADSEISGAATVSPDGTLQVVTSTSVPTTFLSLAGVDELPGHGSATVELRMR
ncbi:pilus assembly protein TadE [Propionimicrobium sp. PCR01-08-3]|uniref:pilus assembly protein TadE n=1 Tax=Propionimicrobium sp. PCR01-08-3 TaxID=3052086 RepID=UPI00255C9C33|nr:pilus assembly protein TadE [Propionimicrobium sp. PCR01-08-3]WIY84081.1 pilus assembly protein TadE [Propionimicrobium sp. PCR01-08-3]